MNKIVVLTSAVLLASCGDNGNSPSSDASDRLPGSYQVIDQDLQPLQDDFNANEGRIRLVFLSGPTCGICLRGMADLNDAFLAQSQDDERLVTFVVHVPTMGAKESHVAESIPLLEGPRIHHYWEESGIIGQHYSEVMGVEMYVWDFWAIYGPNARWDGVLPPKPAYYEHQLGVTSNTFRGFPKERVLDADRFAEKTIEYLDSVDISRFAKQDDLPPSDAVLLADDTDIAYVGQPRNVAVRQHIMGRGGYRNLKRISGIQATGRLAAGDLEYSMTVTTSRANEIRRELMQGGQVSTATRNSEMAIHIDSILDRGLPTVIEEVLLDSYEFDGLVVEWPDKGHKVSMQGMRKFGDVLAWRLELRQANGRKWHMFIDSHSGDLVQKHLLDEDDVASLVIRQSDFRQVSGFRFPHQIEYIARDGKLLATEIIDSIAVEVDAFDIEEEAVTH